MRVDEGFRSRSTSQVLCEALTFSWERAYARLDHCGVMNNKTKRTIAVSTALLAGTGMAVSALPAQATPLPASAVSGVRALSAPATASVKTATIVYRTGATTGKSSIKAAPKLVHAKKKKKKKKSKKRYRSRRS